MTTLHELHSEVEHWFFDEYFLDFIAIGAGRASPDKILSYWGVPLHMSGPTHVVWVTSSEQVVHSLNEMQGLLKKKGYTHTEVLDKTITVYSRNASRVETIMSRRKADGTEIDRAAISFELRRAGENWIIISTAAQPTDRSTLREVW